MRKIVVISGKGGTGKTTVIANLAALAKNFVLADCDVDAPNLHLLLKPYIKEEQIFESGKRAIKEENKCISCGKCVSLCRFKAISPDLQINPIKCEGCGVCVAICPENALSLETQKTGRIFVSDTDFATMIHARLNAGAENSGKLVSKVREMAEEAAKREGKDLLLIDGSPGIGCPVVASLKGVNQALIVTEPTLSALSDLKRLVKLIDLFRITALLVINKYDLNVDITKEIESYSVEKKIEVIGRISFSPLVNHALREGKLLLETQVDCKISEEIKSIWKNIEKMT